MNISKLKAILIIIVILIQLNHFSLADDNTDDNSEDKYDTSITVTTEDSEEVKVAPNLNLKDVAPAPEPVKIDPTKKTNDEDEIDTKKTIKTEENTKSDSEIAEDDYPTASAVKEQAEREKLVILGAEVPPGTSTRLAWSPQVNISGLALPTPVLVINGAEPGPTLCLTGAIHGDELNGIEVVRRVMYDITPKDLKGTLIGVPIVNLQGFQRGSRYLTDRRDLNR
jgi:hypothetical protein